MLATPNLFDLLALLFGVMLLLKRVADMDRYHALRIIVLTSILSIIVIYLVLGYGFTLRYNQRFV